MLIDVVGNITTDAVFARRDAYNRYRPQQAGNPGAIQKDGYSTTKDKDD
jgi:hypothetical protein